VSQTQRNLVVLAALVVVAGALGLYAYFGVMKTEERETQRKETSEKLFSAYPPGQKAEDGGAPPAAVFTSIVVKAKGEATTLEKKGEDWAITSPLSARADRSAVEQIINQLQNGRFKSTVEENPSAADLSKYGLDQPKFTVTAYAYVPDSKGEGANDASRRREVTLHGGIENTFDGSIYMRRQGDNAIYAVDGGVRFSLEKTTFDLRDKEVLAVDEASLKQVDFKSKSNRYLLERDEGKTWQLKAPKASPADGTTITTMIGSFKNERALAFPRDSPEERKRLGLIAPAVDITFAREGGEKVRIRLNKAKVDDGEKIFALRESGQDAILAEVPVGALTALDKSASDLRDKSVLAFKREEVAKIVLSPGGNAPEIAVEKVATDGGSGGEDWQVTAPEKGPAKKWKLSSVLWSLSSLKATAVDEENSKEWGKYGIVPSSRSVALMDQSGKIVAKLQVGKEVKGKANALYVKGSRNNVLQMDSAKLDELPWKLADVLDKPVPALDAGRSGISSN